MWCFIHYLQRNLQRIIDTIRNDAYLRLQGKTIWGTMSQIRVTSEGMKVKVDAHMRQQGPMS
jgi:hypothetical protein